MTTHKIGNQINCVIRAYSCNPIGTYQPQYDGEPYTIIQGENGLINFDTQATNMEGVDVVGSYSTEKIKTLSIYNVTLTDKILNLIYSKNEGFSVTYHEKLFSTEDKKIYLTKGLGKTKKMVFIYYSPDKQAPVLEQALSTAEGDELEVNHAEGWYNVVYEVISNHLYSLDTRKNVCVSLDITSVSNEDDNTTETHIHIDKAVVQVNKTLYFNSKANAVDLTFIVIHDKDTVDYIGWAD